MASSTVFSSNRSQAVRLSKAVAFPAAVHQVDVLKIGRSRVIVPKGQRWDDFFLNEPCASEDFMNKRVQPARRHASCFDVHLHAGYKYLHLRHQETSTRNPRKIQCPGEQLCISSITFGELHDGAEKSLRRAENLANIRHFAARSEVLPFTDKAAAHYGQVRAELERAGTPCGINDMQIGAHARSEGLIVVTNHMREFDRIPGIRAENWLPTAIG